MKITALKKFLIHNRFGRILIILGSYAHTLLSVTKFAIFRGFRRIGFTDSSLLDIKGYKDIHKNKRCFIIATGPSLRVSDLDKLKDEITLSVNSICHMFDKTEWRPTYYGIQDEVGFDRVKGSLNNENRSIYLFNDKFRDKVINDNNFIKDKSILFFPLRYGLHGSRLDFKNKTNGFSDDAYLEVVDGYTITYSLIQIAVHMGIREIYLLGVDNSYSKPGPKHFVDHEDDKNIALSKWKLIEKRMASAYLEAKKHANIKGIKIYNATRGGELEVFQRVNFDEVINNELCCENNKRH